MVCAQQGAEQLEEYASRVRWMILEHLQVH